ncbi:MAG: M16 family metallopeptidase [Actinomycetota bacterium]
MAGRPTTALLATLALLAIACAPPRPPEGAGGIRGNVELPVENYFLDNGLEVILRKDDRVPVASVNLWYHVGAADDGPGRTGYAHLFEHMMLQGSRHVTKDPFEILEAAGASYFNGNTDLDRTTYLEDVPANQLELALWIESDRMGYLLDTLDQTKLANQQSVVRNERRQTREAAPYGLAQEQVYHELFPEGHPYHAGILGQHSDIAAADLEGMRDFFRRYYGPQNASLAVAGNIDIALTKELIMRYFGTLPRGETAPRRTAAQPQIAEQRRVHLTDRVELPRVYLAWHTPAAYQPGDAEGTIAARMLGGGRSSRLHERLVFDRKIAQSVSATQRSLALGSVFQIVATAKPGHTADELEQAIQQEVDLLARQGPSEIELSATKTGIVAVTVKSLEQIAVVADRLNAYNHYLGDPNFINDDLDRYAAVTAASLKRFLSGHLRADNTVVVQVEPGDRLLPPEPPAPAPADMPPASLPPDPEPWRSVQPGPGPAPQVRIPVAQRFELANGLPVHHVARRSLPLVSAYLTVRSGTAADPPTSPGLAAFTSAMIDEGTASRDAITIARRFGQLGATIDTGTSREESWVVIQSLTQTFGEALELMAESVLGPTFPQSDVDRVRNNLVVGLQQQRDESMEVAHKIMWRELYGPDHPYAHTVLGTEEALRRMTRPDLEAFHRTGYTPANSALVITGDLSLGEARRLAEQSFGSWRGEAPAPPDLSRPTPSAQRVFLADKPGLPQSALIVAQLAVARSHPDYEQLLMANQLLGGLFSSRLNQKLREEQGVTYRLDSSLFANRGVAPLRVSTRVENGATGSSAGEILAEINRLGREGINQAELDLARDALIQALPALFQTNGSVAATVAGQFLFDLPAGYYAGRAARVTAFTLDEVNEALRRHLRSDQLKLVVVGDRASLEPQLALLGMGPTALRSLDAEPVSEP